MDLRNNEIVPGIKEIVPEINEIVLSKKLEQPEKQQTETD